MTSWHAHKGHITSTTRNQRLMKSQWRFLRPGERQCLHGFSIAETNTLGSPPLCCIQLSARCVLLSIFDRNVQWCHETEWSSYCFTGNSTQKGFLWRIYPSPCSLWGAATTSVPITPMTALRTFPASGHNNELIYILIPPWEAVHSSQPYACLRYMEVMSEKRRIFNFSLLQICTSFPLYVVCGHIVRRGPMKSSQGW